jgi:DNA polymerase III epsilon subunit-like protein
MQVARVYLDIETTGLDPAYHSVVEIGAVAVDSQGVELSSYQSLANPGGWAMKNSEPRAFEVSGIDPADVRAARPIGDVAKEFLAWASGKGKLHAYPVQFERGFLVREPWSVASIAWGDCVMELVRDIMGRAGALPMMCGRPKRPRLSEAAEFFKVKSDRFHRALDDARTTSLVHRAAVDIVLGLNMNDEVKNIMDRGM